LSAKTLPTKIEPSTPEFSAIWRIGASRALATFFARHVPDAFYRDLRHFAVELFSKRDPAGQRVHVVV